MRSWTNSRMTTGGLTPTTANHGFHSPAQFLSVTATTQEEHTSMIDLEFLTSIKSYIEEMEEVVDGEWGNCRSVAELVIAGLMPQLYSEVISRIKLLTPPKEENFDD
jgi:hypothetical protein